MKGQYCLYLLSISRFQTFFCSTQRFYMFGFRNTSTFASLHDDGAACSSPNSARKLFVDNEFKWREGVNFQADKNRNIWATVFMRVPSVAMSSVTRCFALRGFLASLALIRFIISEAESVADSLTTWSKQQRTLQLSHGFCIWYKHQPQVLQKMEISRHQLMTSHTNNISQTVVAMVTIILWTNFQ